MRERRAALAARVARLDAEARGSEPVFPPELLADAASAVRSEKAVYDARALKFARDLDVLTQQEWQKQTELDELKASERKLAEPGS